VDRERVQTLLRDLKAGKVTVGQAVEALRDLPYEDLGFAKLTPTETCAAVFRRSSFASARRRSESSDREADE